MTDCGSGKSPINDVPADLVNSVWATPAHLLMTFSAPSIVARVRPGQFVHVRVSPAGTSPLLRRPFSVAGINNAQGTFRMLVRTVGRGTELLAELLPGARLDVLGPLGRPFPDVPEERPVVAVAGGVGVAPLLYVASSRRKGIAKALYGAATASELALSDELRESCGALYQATDDGSEGHHGFVTELLPAALDGLTDPVVLCCGPRPMMAAAAAICGMRDVECHVSFEAWMGCGIGACLGCVIPAAGGSAQHVRVCKDGPVFNADEIDWEALR